MADFTVAFRFGDDLQRCIYYTVYPKVDIDFVDADNRVYFMVSPATIGYETRLRRNPKLNFAIEMGYAFPVPWNSIEPENWVNFPSLANVGLYFRW